MRKFFLYTICLFLLALCSTDFNNDIEVSGVQTNFSDAFIEELISVSKHYGYVPGREVSNVADVLYAAANGDNTKLKDKDSGYGVGDIALADARGFVKGVTLGSRSGNPFVIFGTAIGMSVFSSVDCYDKQNDGSGNDGGGGNGGDTAKVYNPFLDNVRISPIDLRKPINDDADFL